MPRFKLPQLTASLLLLGLSFSIVQARRPNRAAVLDFDGDGKTDYVVVRSQIPAGGNNTKLVWHIMGSRVGPYAVQWGLDGMQLVPADYDGDGKWDIAVWSITGPVGSPAYFHIWRSSDSTYQYVQWGTTQDDPLETQDFDGDGKADPTVVRSDGATGLVYWYSLLSSTGQMRVTQFGYGDDRLLRGDYDGDGKADIAVYRREHGYPANTFIIQRSSDNQVEYFPFGKAQTDIVYPADFDGDGKTDFAVARIIDNQRWWFWRESSTGIVRARQFGQAGSFTFIDNLVPGDYDGDGKTDFAVWRTTDFQIPSYFYVDGSQSGFTAMQWGLSSIENAPAGSLQVH